MGWVFQRSPNKQTNTRLPSQLTNKHTPAFLKALSKQNQQIHCILIYSKEDLFDPLHFSILGLNLIHHPPPSPSSWHRRGASCMVKGVASSVQELIISCSCRPPAMNATAKRTCRERGWERKVDWLRWTDGCCFGVKQLEGGRLYDLVSWSCGDGVGLGAVKGTGPCVVLFNLLGAFQYVLCRTNINLRKQTL